MPPTRVVIYCDENGEAPFIAWLLSLPAVAQDKVRLRTARLAELGHEMRRPEADYLRRKRLFENHPGKHTLKGF
jgi:hypothetical protein